MAGLEDLRVLREAVEHVYIDPLVKRWAVDLVRATRELPFLELGASVRASLALDRASRAWALAAWPRLRRPGGRRAALRAGRHPPDPARRGAPRRRERLARTRSPVASGRRVSSARRGPSPSGTARRPVRDERPRACGRSRSSRDDDSAACTPGRCAPAQRGGGDEAAGSRPYRPGDRISWVDWAASARLSAARGSDELVVREFFADQAPRAVIVCDRRPSLGIYAAPLPWLDKPAAIAEIVELVRASARAARGDVGLVSANAVGPFFVPPGRAPSNAWLGERAAGPAEAPPDALARSLDLLVRRRAALPVGTFVFVVSDFLEPVPSRRVGAAPRAGLGRDAGSRAGPGLGAVVSSHRRGDGVRLSSPARPGQPTSGSVGAGPRPSRRRTSAGSSRRSRGSGGSASTRSSSGTSDRVEITRLLHAWAARRRSLRRRRA